MKCRLVVVKHKDKVVYIQILNVTNQKREKNQPNSLRCDGKNTGSFSIGFVEDF